MRSGNALAVIFSIFLSALATAKPINTPTHKIFSRGICGPDPPQPNPLDWKTAISKGHANFTPLLLKMNAEIPSPDDDSARVLYNKVAYHKTYKTCPVVPQCMFRIFLGYMQAPVDQHYYQCTINRAVVGKGTVQCERYVNSYRSQGRIGGVIVAHDIARNRGPLHWSDATYYSWAEYNRNNIFGVQSLRYIMHYNVENLDTMRIIDKAYDNSGISPEIPHSWTPTDDAFYAMMGTPNGNGVPHMLTDHFLALGKLTIKSIETVAPSRDLFAYLGFTLEVSTPEH
ncbi:hypothetical protein MMC06_002836 [Schaereria dolodes]|nr:hypothetical protein [Schaereria dolodes]